MDTGAPFELLLVPLALLATLAGLFLLARRWQQRTLAELERVRADWRRFESTRQNTAAAYRALEGEQQEPFYSRLVELGGLLAALDHRAERLNRRRIDLKQQANNLSTNTWQSLVGGPFVWYALRRDLQRWDADLAAAREILNQAEAKEASLRRIGWGTALEARQARKLQQELQAALDRLAERRLHGDEFDTAIQECRASRTELDGLDPDLFTADEEVILARLDRGAIAAAHAVVGKVRPSLEAHLSRAGEWERRLAQAGESGARLNRMLDETEAALSQLPASVDAEADRRRLAAMREIARTLTGTLTRPAVDGIVELEAEFENQFRLARELREVIKRSRREAAALEAAVKELPAAFKELSLQMAALGAKSIRPVQWQASLEALTDLTRKANKLGGKEPKPPEKIEADLKMAVDLRSRQKELSEHIEQVREMHSTLVDLLADPRLTGLEDWLNDARPIISKAAKYAPENWPRQAGTAELPDEIEALAREAERLGVQRAADAVSEAGIVAALEQTQMFIERCERARQHTTALRGRLEALVAAEDAAIEQVETARATLGQMEFLASSNELLNEIAAGEMKRFSGEAGRIFSGLSERDQGRVEMKARQAQAFIERIESASNRWLDRLGREIGSLTAELGNLLNTLDEIAALEEKSVLEARRLLASGAGFSTAGRLERAAYALDDLVPELKRRSDAWNALNAAIRALQDFAPLIETYQNAEERREHAREALAAAAALVRSRRAWPPTTISFDDERSEMEAIDAEWQALRERGGRAIARTAQLGGLAARAQALADRIAQTAERAGRERTEVEDHEAQIGELAEQWRAHLHRYGEYPEAAAEIQALLEDIHQILAQIRRDYAQGAADYATTLQAVKTLAKRVRYYQVALDDQSALDVQGNIQRRRDSRRV